MHMISTIRGATDVFEGKKIIYKHKDELWIWIPETEIAIEHLKSFLLSFSKSDRLIGNEVSCEFLGSNASTLEQIFQESFLDIPMKKVKKNMDMAVIYYNAGTINSRKAMISPYLPSIAG